MADLQRTVDDLAARVNRPLVLEDRTQRVVAYSEQSGAMDDIRRDSILLRQTGPEVRAWLADAGVPDADAPLRTPGAPGLGLLPRVCVPVRHSGALLGFLWFIDNPPMPDEDVAVAAALVPQLALTLFHESVASRLAAHRELEAVTRLLDGAPDAARTLVEAGAAPQGQPVTALVAKPVAGQANEASRLALEQGLLALRRKLTAHHALHLVRYDHGVLLVSGVRGEAVLAHAEEVHAALSVPVVVGVGESRKDLAETSSSYGEALRAAETAARVPGLGRTVEWARLGVYRLLSQVSDHEFHPGLEALLADPQHLPLLETLETYLDLAGSAVATSRRLRLHRTSLYYRLQRVEELAATDLKDGGERLALHLGLKLARLSGRYRPRS
ncbi:PucR family transcriptional regulator [Nonomuraea longicatena]|uniref:Helix-turn-helix domain-containing protein n=1 Tax=Nonomuraea longicatena TaxID=83682 RepID=A0ABP3Z0T0_9ACTN